ncbi:NTP transferase domain-containing protein [Muribaculum sp.]|jgi:NDP-sugar pyrophosphorylase family protein|uniref:NTP transferase domain-containing protein n=1 Tax=Muribaculum sp. TaxID=1918611 RepID=UPI00257FF4A4|nr:NTP transferase domain-containing protein [Muribaculum sp.]
MHYAIIAAGEGSRLVQEGVALPKPLVDLDGRPMIKRLIDIMLDNNAESIAVIVNEQMTQVRQYLESLKLDTEFLLVVKTTPSSMHSFWEVSRAFPESGKFVLTTVDTIFRADDFATYVEAFENAPAGTDGYMGVTSFIDDEKPLYVDVEPGSMKISGFKDQPFEGMKYISGGIYGLTAPALDVLRTCIDTGISRMRNYQRALVESGLRLQAWPFPKIVDVDHAADIATAREFINQ